MLTWKAKKARLVIESDPAARARLVDLLGVVGNDTDEVLLHLALDTDEPDPVRVAAIAALGARGGDRSDAVLHQLARHDEEVGTHAALALSGRLHGAPAGADRSDGTPIPWSALSGMVAASSGSVV